MFGQGERASTAGPTGRPDWPGVRTASQAGLHCVASLSTPAKHKQSGGSDPTQSGFAQLAPPVHKAARLPLPVTDSPLRTPLCKLSFIGGGSRTAACGQSPLSTAAAR